MLQHPANFHSRKLFFLLQLHIFYSLWRCTFQHPVSAFCEYFFCEFKKFHSKKEWARYNKRQVIAVFDSRCYIHDNFNFLMQEEIKEWKKFHSEKGKRTSEWHVEKHNEKKFSHLQIFWGKSFSFLVIRKTIVLYNFSHYKRRLMYAVKFAMYLKMSKSWINLEHEFHKFITRSCYKLCKSFQVPITTWQLHSIQLKDFMQQNHTFRTSFCLKLKFSSSLLFTLSQHVST